MGASAPRDRYGEDSLAEFARTLLIHGPLTRQDLANRIGVSLPTLTRLTRPLVADGLVVELTDPQEGAVGRPNKPLDVQADARYFVGMKLTGDAAFAVLTDLRANELAHAEVGLNERSISSVVQVLISLMQRLESSIPEGGRIDAVGVSLGGFVRDDGLITYARYLGWEDVDLRGPLEAALGVPVTLENDVVAVVAAEGWFGFGRGLTDFAVVTIGAGVGFGMVRDDRVVRNADARVGTLGHIPLSDDGPTCSSGHVGCATALLTIPSLCAEASRYFNRLVTFEELLLVDQDDAFVTGMFNMAATALGKLLAMVANISLLDNIVLSGEAVGLFRLRQNMVESEMSRYREAENLPIRVLVDESSFIAWARGAAAIAIQDSYVRLVEAAHRSAMNTSA